MTSSSTTGAGLRGLVNALPVPDLPLFRALWSEGRLHYDQRTCGDLVDQYSAHLLAAAQAKRASLFIVLPDERTYRPAFLFTNALVTHWWQARQAANAGRSRPVVLYIGSHIGIRQQLQLVTFNGFNLSSVFQLSHLGSRTKRESLHLGESSNALAEVITAYAPVAPKDLIDQSVPDLILLDLADAAESRWLDAVLQHAVERNIPVLGWGTNPLSECVTRFAKQDGAFVWPLSTFFSKDIPLGELYLGYPKIHSVGALVVVGSEIDEISAVFRRIYGLLLRASRSSDGELSRKTAAVHWNYLRTVEGISIPGDIYESESRRFWGYRSVQAASELSARFREAQPQSAVTADLELAATLIDEVWNKIRKSPPLWNALLNLCFDDRQESPRIIRFPSRAKKQMFLLALLALQNITEQDLREVEIDILTLDDPAPSYEHDVVIPGFPGVRSFSRLTPFFAGNAGKFIIFPHQLKSLDNRLVELKSLLIPGQSETTAIVERLRHSNGHPPTPREPRGVFPDVTQCSLQLAEAREISGTSKGGEASPRLFNRAVIERGSAVEELTKLLEPNEINEEPDQTDFLDEPSFENPSTPENQSSEVCSDAVRIRFRENCAIDFPTDACVQVVVNMPSRTSLQERFVSSLRRNDKILYIEGQKRQTLYDLILSRVHAHPSFQIHLALIRRWKQDLLIAHKSSNNSLSPEEILSELQKRGSNILTTLTVRNWLNGLCLCPDDPEDLRRLAEIMNLGFVLDQYKRIFKAAQRIRGLHIGLGLRLCGWLEGAAKGFDNDTEVFDQELGLTLADFKTSLIVLTVESITKLSGPFIRSTLGNLEYDREVK